MQRLGIRFEVVEALLNHTGKSQGGVAGIYQRHDWASEKRSALQAWSLHVRQIVAISSGGNIISIEAARSK
jgi:hypothetical protein